MHAHTHTHACTNLSRYVLDLDVLPRRLHVTDLDEPSGCSAGDCLLLLLMEPRSLGDRLRHGGTLAGTLLPGRGDGNVQPAWGEGVGEEEVTTLQSS